MRWLALSAAAALVASASAASTAPSFPARVLTVRAPASDLNGAAGVLALDGPYAAYAQGTVDGRSCQLGARVYRWNLATGRVSRASGGRTCALGQSSTGSGIEQIAVAGSRTAWLVNEGGNTFSGETLFSTSAVPGKDAILGTSARTGDYPPSTTGTWIGGLVSDGSRISYSTWTTTSTQAVTASALWRIAGPQGVELASGSGGAVSASADAGRVALLRPDGTVAVYGIGGQLLRTVAPSSAQAVALSGELLAVLTKTKTVDVYDRGTGALMHSWPIAGGAAPKLTAGGGIAVYVTWRSIHALDLLTGKDAVVATQSTAIEDARLDGVGLLYDYNLPWATHTGKIVFVPFATVADAVG
jgi:hypothetical protein